MNFFKRISIIVTVVLTLALFFKECGKENRTVTQIENELNGGENEQITIDMGRHTVSDIKREQVGDSDRNPNHNVVRATWVPNAKRAVITVTKDGKVSLDVQTKGFCFEPGISAGFLRGPAFGGDIKLGYWNRLGLNSGLMYGTRSKELSLYGGLSWAVYSNTSLVLGVTHRKDIFLGVRIAL